MTDRLKAQLDFLNEVEKLKIVYRRNRTVDRARFENSAEHSWHIALKALVLSEHADTKHLDLFKVVKMLLIHDLVEIHAGDTWLYDAEAAREQAEKEQAGAASIFGMLPTDQAAEFLSLWNEFEARQTAEAAYAAAIDALQPLSNCLLTGEPAPDDVIPKRAAVLDRKRHIQDSSQTLWQVARKLIDDSTNLGLYQGESADLTPDSK